MTLRSVLHLRSPLVCRSHTFAYVVLPGRKQLEWIDLVLEMVSGTCVYSCILAVFDGADIGGLPSALMGTAHAQAPLIVFHVGQAHLSI